MLLSEDDAKKVAKMMENQISGLSRERKQAARQERADQEQAQVSPVHWRALKGLPNKRLFCN
jgi:hypothetical protein